MDLWQYGTKTDEDKEIILNGNVASDNIPGYQNSNITEDGKIQGKVPQYIKFAGKTEFYPVVSMRATFRGCTKLVVAPVIPSSVTNMTGTFENCTSLTTAPKIPSSVTYMRRYI